MTPFLQLTEKKKRKEVFHRVERKKKASFHPSTPTRHPQKAAVHVSHLEKVGISPEVREGKVTKKKSRNFVEH